MVTTPFKAKYQEKGGKELKGRELGEKKDQIIRPQNIIIFVTFMIMEGIMNCDMAVSVEGC